MKQEMPPIFIVHDYFTPYNTNSSPADILKSAVTVCQCDDYLKQQWRNIRYQQNLLHLPRGIFSPQDPGKWFQILRAFMQ
jgi:hypothetical protein